MTVRNDCQSNGVARHSDRVYNAESQPTSTVTVDQIAIAVKTIRADGAEHWLHTAVDPATSEFPPVCPFSRRRN